VIFEIPWLLLQWLDLGEARGTEVISEIPWLLLQWLGLFGEVSRRQEGAGLLLPVSIAVFDLYFCSGDSTCPRSDDVSIFEVNSNVKAWCAFGVMMLSFFASSV